MPPNRKPILDVDLFDEVLESSLSIDDNFIWMFGAIWYVSQDDKIEGIIEENIDFNKCKKAKLPLSLHSVLKDINKRVSRHDEPVIYAFLFIWNAFRSKKFSLNNKKDSLNADSIDIFARANEFFKWLLYELQSDNMPKQLDHIRKSVMEDQIEEILQHLQPLEEDCDKSEDSADIEPTKKIKMSSPNTVQAIYDILKELVISEGGGETEKGKAKTVNVNDFFKEMVISYENDSSIRIKRGRSKKVWRHKDMGFTRNDTKEWKVLLKSIKNKDNIIKLPVAKIYSKDGLQKIRTTNKPYDQEMQILYVINNKLKNFFAKEYSIEISKKFSFFKVWGKGYKKFILKVDNAPETSIYDGYDKNMIIKEIRNLTNRANDPPEKLIMATNYAKNKLDMSDEEIKNILPPEYKEDIKYDEHENIDKQD